MEALTTDWLLSPCLPADFWQMEALLTTTMQFPLPLIQRLEPLALARP
jgi:hypothetical protein